MTAAPPEQVYTEYDGGIRRCAVCRRFTTEMEAQQRLFNTGWCACGGGLVWVPQRDYSPTAHHDPGDEDRT